MGAWILILEMKQKRGVAPTTMGYVDVLGHEQNAVTGYCLPLAAATKALA
jgi:hypothetical protein